MGFDAKFVADLVNNINSDNCNKLYGFLASPDSDFFTAPGSTRFHHSYEGGLLVHCCQIFEYLLKYKLAQMFRLDTIEFNQEDAFLLSFGHDLSKINKYQEEEGWTKVDGKWKSFLKYGYNKDVIIPHELGSVYMLVKLLPDVKFDIVQAIAYHHGSFNQSTQYEYSDACRTNPLVLALHTADMESSIKDDIERENNK